jgi:hypothetical protein
MLICSSNSFYVVRRGHEAKAPGRVWPVTWRPIYPIKLDDYNANLSIEHGIKQKETTRPYTIRGEEFCGMRLQRK